MKARPLDRGRPVAVVAASGPLNRRKLEKGIDWLERSGHPVVGGRSLLARHGFLAGKDSLRAGDLNAAIHHPDEPAIFFARGGWGAARILDRIDLDGLRRRDRILLGFSDLTSLFMALQKDGRPCPYRYGPTVVELGEPGAFHRGSLEEALYLSRGEIRHGSSAMGVVRRGKGRGPLIGGCLSMLVGLLGTPYDSSWDGCILFWEEVNEEPYRLDRMLTQLRLAGKLKGLKGMVVGRPVGCRPRPGSPSLPLKEILMDATAGAGYPVITGFPAGHMAGKRTLLMGVPARLDADRKTLILEWSAGRSPARARARKA